MHQTAYDTGRFFFQIYWQPGFSRILDVGSQDVNGTLRPIAPPAANYTGVDLVAGPGVDLVLTDPYSYPFVPGSFDCIVSTSCFEHDDMFWLTFSEMCRVLKSDGFIYINAPSSGVYHGFPRDCWRFYPDSGIALEKWGRRMSHDISLVESFQFDGTEGHFRDFVMVFAGSGASVPSRSLRDEVQSIYATVNARVGSSGELIAPKVAIS